MGNVIPAKPKVPSRTARPVGPEPPILWAMTDRLPADVGILFLAGCPRTGTTALQEYLNVHPQVMVCRERYKWIEPSAVTLTMFEPDRLIDFDRATERYRTDTRRMHMQAILDSKSVAELRWVGDKFPGYLRSIPTLALANPGARFIVTHREVEPVVNSYLARAANEDDSWLGGRDVVDLAINTWNRSLLEFLTVLTDDDIAVLPVAYEAFHADPRMAAARIGGFLDIDMPDELVAEWRRRSDEHRQDRSTDRYLTGDVLARIAHRADRDLEDRVLAAIASP